MVSQFFGTGLAERGNASTRKGRALADGYVAAATLPA
jgi:hypothetical protein